MKLLSKCDIGECVKVTRLASSEIQSQLVELGIYEGKELSILYKAPLGDPIAVSVGSFVLSMRIKDAENILVDNIYKHEENCITG